MNRFVSVFLRSSALLFLTGILGACANTPDTYRMIVGTYTENTFSKGLYVYEVNIETGNTNQLFVSENVTNPSYIALSPDNKQLYAVNEFGQRSTVSAFSFDERTGRLRLLSVVPTPDADPCYITVTDKHVLTAGYTSGSISVFGRNTDGSLSHVRQVIRHAGKSIDPVRQDAPHVHQAILTPDRRYVLSCDLGTDQITVYRYYAGDTATILAATDSIEVKKGSGPRHLVFNTTGDRAYLLQELDGTVTVLSMDTNGKCAVLQETTISLNDSTGNGAAAIHISPDGRFVYASNRGTADNITCFSVQKNGQLELVEQVAAGGKGPRDFTITPDGHYLFVANQQTNNITVFKRNKYTGKLTPADTEIKISAPVCLLIY